MEVVDGIKEEDTEGCVGKPEEGFRRKHHNPEASTPTVSRHAMEAADVIIEGGTEVMPTPTLDPPETGGVEAMRTDRGRPSQSADIVARKAIEKASVRRGRPIRKKLSQTRKMAMITLRRRLSRSQNSMKVSNSKPNEVW